MKIENDTRATDILGSHEKRIGTLELVLQGFLTVLCLKGVLRIILDKLHNLLLEEGRKK